MANKSKISIVTVTYNNLAGLKNTLFSVRKQSYKNYQHIVIDGGSNDGTRKYLERQTGDSNLLFLSERDSGIYNAMNKGISLADGDWLLFLNAGDLFASEGTLEELSLMGVFEDFDLDLVYGDKIDSENRVVKAKKDLSCLYFGEMPACHQSIFFRSNIEYDESFRIYGDIDLLSKIYLSNPKYRHVETPISIYEGGGISSEITWVKRREKIRSLFKNFGISCVFRNYIFNFKSYKKIFIWS